MLSLFRSHQAKKPHIAAQQTNLPLSDELTLMLAEEIPMLDSVDRAEVYRLLRAYDGPQITTQDDLPARIKELLDLP